MKHDSRSDSGSKHKCLVTQFWFIIPVRPYLLKANVKVILNEMQQALFLWWLPALTLPYNSAFALKAQWRHTASLRQRRTHWSIQNKTEWVLTHCLSSSLNTTQSSWMHCKYLKVSLFFFFKFTLNSISQCPNSGRSSYLYTVQPGFCWDTANFMLHQKDHISLPIIILILFLICIH